MVGPWGGDCLTLHLLERPINRCKDGVAYPMGTKKPALGGPMGVATLLFIQDGRVAPVFHVNIEEIERLERFA